MFLFSFKRRSRSDLSRYNRSQTCENLEEFWTVCRTLNRKSELERLLKWSVHRRLAGPQKGYQFQLDDIEQRLLKYTLHSPGVTKWARRLHAIKRLLIK